MIKTDRWKKSPDGKCVECGIELAPGRRKFCSTDCKCKNRVRHNPPKPDNTSRRERTKYTITCAYCQTVFQTIYQSRKYCNIDCYSRGQYMITQARKDREQEFDSRKAGTPWKGYKPMEDCVVSWRKTRGWMSYRQGHWVHEYEVKFEFADHTRIDKFEVDVTAIQHEDELDSYIELVIANEIGGKMVENIVDNIVY